MKFGFEIINLPTIEAKPLEDLRDFETKLRSIKNYDGIFITSKIAAQILAEKIGELKIKFAGKVHILGKRSFEILKSKYLNPIFFEDANTAAEMLEKISTDKLKDKNFLFIRGEKSLETIPKFLSEIAVCDESIVYQNQTKQIDSDTISAIKELFEALEIEAICFFSPSGAESFIEKFGTEILHQTRIAVIGKTTADFFGKQNITVNFVSPKATAKYFAESLIEHLEKKMPIIKENRTDRKVFIDEIVINGFVDEKLCQNCRTNKIYFDDYDSYFCPNCNVWLESKCSDLACEFCQKRPEKPLSI